MKSKGKCETIYSPLQKTQGALVASPNIASTSLGMITFPRGNALNPGKSEVDNVGPSPEEGMGFSQ